MLLNILYSLCLSQLVCAAVVSIQHYPIEISQRSGEPWTKKDVDLCRPIPEPKRVKEFWFSSLSNDYMIIGDSPQEGLGFIRSAELFESDNCEEYRLTPTLFNVDPYQHDIIERQGKKIFGVDGTIYKSFRFSLKDWSGLYDQYNKNIDAAKKTSLNQIEKLQAEDPTLANKLIPNMHPDGTLAELKTKMQKIIEYSYLWPAAGQENQKIQDVSVKDILAMVTVNAPYIPSNKNLSVEQLRERRESFYQAIRNLLIGGDMIWPNSSEEQALKAVKIVLGK